MKFVLEDIDMDGQLQRTASAAYSGSADLGEALALRNAVAHPNEHVFEPTADLRRGFDRRRTDQIADDQNLRRHVRALYGSGFDAHRQPGAAEAGTETAWATESTAAESAKTAGALASCGTATTLAIGLCCGL